MDWLKSLIPLFDKYGKLKHPLEYQSTYQLLVMVVLSARTTDTMVNKIAPALFKTFPSMKHLAKAAPDKLTPYIKSLTGFRKKGDWLIRIAKALGDKNIPLIIDELVQLPGIGRKSANVIIREAGGEPQGIFTDLHVLRVVPRLGITEEEKPDKIEKSLMEIIPKKYWHAAGMSFSYLGREVCRPTDPKCEVCLLSSACEYFKHLGHR